MYLMLIGYIAAQCQVGKTKLMMDQRHRLLKLLSKCLYRGFSAKGKGLLATRIDAV